MVFYNKLLLGWNPIGSKGAAAIASNASWKKLKVLNLAANRIGDEGAIALGRGDISFWVSHYLTMKLGGKARLLLVVLQRGVKTIKLMNTKLTEERMGTLVACPVVYPGVLWI